MRETFTMSELSCDMQELRFDMKPIGHIKLEPIQYEMKPTETITHIKTHRDGEAIG